MPELERPGGVQIHWEAEGEGPVVVLSLLWLAHRGVFRSLIEDLARDHRVVTWDTRGTGESTRTGPYDIETDAGDLTAVAEAAGGAAVLLDFLAQRSILVASTHPELARGVVTTGSSPALSAADLEGDEGLAGSRQVIDALERLMESDYRAALRTVVTSTKPQMSEEEVRTRVDATAAYMSEEAALGRLRAQRRVPGLVDEARALGDRLAIVFFESPWFPRSMFQRAAALLPEARYIEAEDGPISRPDITTQAVRDLERHTIEQ